MNLGNRGGGNGFAERHEDFIQRLAELLGYRGAGRIMIERRQPVLKG